MNRMVPPAYGVRSNDEAVPLLAVIEAIKERTPWPFMREVLKKNGIPPGNGWGLLIANASNTLAGGSTVEEFIRKFHREILISGERYVKLYELEQSHVSLLEAKLRQATPHRSEFSAKYPLPLVNQVLKGMDEAPTLVDVRHYSNGDCCLVYCSSRSYEHRERYDYRQLGKEVQNVYKGIDQLITIERRYFQAYDVVFFRKSLMRLELCIDQPGRGGVKVAERAVNRLLPLLCAQSSTFEIVFQRQPLNLFPAIAGIYRTPGEGTVKTLSFRTLTGSTKTEKMQSDNDDLRREDFHSAGAQAVGNQIRPYEIEVDFTFPGTKDFASVVLAAPMRELSADPANLHHCFVITEHGGATSLALNKVVKYLP